MGMTETQQNNFVTQVYKVLFQQQETGTEQEIKDKIKAKAGQILDPGYTQRSNTLYYDYEAFLCHLYQVNSRSMASFAISFLLNQRLSDGSNQVLSRTVVSSQEDQTFESGVVSLWTFSDEGKLISCRETLFDISDADGCGVVENPMDWTADVRI